MSLIEFEAGNYKFLAGGAFSDAVVANPGFRLHRVRFAQAMPMEEGFERLAGYLRTVDRPTSSLAACELRSPTPRSREDFNAFNDVYVKHLHALGCRLGDKNPVARSNMAPLLSKPARSLLYAFSYTEPLQAHDSSLIGPDFVVSGKPENKLQPDGSTLIVGGDQMDATAMVEKARYTLDVMMARVRAIGARWDSVGSLQIYCPTDLSPLWSTFEEYGLAHVGLHWFPGWPPVKGMHFEVDVRRTSKASVLDIE
ncbi:MAG: hypothetical protein EBT36_06480 [Betaproteobacteria bacterium]|jgi:hypothetical protein|nr:hypothetical protein [Pseudomonadota bacterium]NBO95273.1 hypothetical protein [Betaproteobacteria bacterium]NBP35457.1 hypothetical protein [Betaproteobacteria bacterium]NBP37743.1 hypothetical protein [Betaproteobacteria bacterium]NBQ94753.1 hypothetical protein [Betaproteobacteria bacterium]